jgi:membrane protease YdiL (CAAX protease family)
MKDAIDSSKIDFTVDVFSDNKDISVYIMFLLSLALFLFVPENTSDAYFFAPRFYFYPVAFFLFISKLAQTFKKSSVALISWTIAAMFFCYGAFEVLYSCLPGIKVSKDAEYEQFWNEIISYGGNRSLQLIPIVLLAGILYFRFKNFWRHRLKKGDLHAETSLLGQNQIMPWSRVCLRVSFYIALITIAFVFLKGVAEYDFIKLQLFGARLFGGAVNSLVEELLFRGLLQPIFELAAGPGLANLLQAFLFSIIHYGFVESLSFSDIMPELIKLLLYLGIGLFLGKAARETDGLVIPWYFHFFITSAIWLTIGFN